MTENLTVCPPVYLHQVITCLRASGGKVSDKLVDLLAVITDLPAHEEQTSPEWVEARRQLADAGYGLSTNHPHWQVGNQHNSSDVSWGDVWLGYVNGQWQVWHRTPQSGWQMIEGKEGQALPSEQATGLFFPRLADIDATLDISSDTPSYWKWVLDLLHGRIATLMQVSMIVNLGMLSMPLFAMLVYDKVVFNGIFETLWALAIGVVLMLALEITMRALRARQVERLSQILDERIDSKLFSSLLKPTLRAGSQPGLAARFQTMYRDLAGARDFFSSNYLLAVADLPFILMIWLVIGVIAWQLLLVILVWVGLYIWLGSLVKAKTLTISKRMTKLQIARQAVLTDSLSSLDLLRTSHVGSRMFSHFMKIAREYSLQTTLQREEVNKSIWLAQVIYAGNYISLLVIGSYLVFDQQMTTGAMIAASMLSGRSLGVIGQALTTLGRWQELKQSLKTLSPFLDEQGEKTTSEEAHTARQIAGSILVHRVNHTYPEAQPCLQTLNFTIAAGQKVAFMGKPGSGKSTLARIISGAILPTEGEVRIDGMGLNAYDVNERMQWLAFKPQEVTLMAGTVEDNILSLLPAWTTPDQRTQALRRGIYFSGLDQDIASGSLSLDRKVDEYGANLSGGQRQKVALARTFALNARIVVLDEPNNGLDTESERLLVKRLSEIKSITLILITHSAMMLSLTQRVIVFDRGQVIADGATNELIKPVV